MAEHRQAPHEGEKEPPPVGAATGDQDSVESARADQPIPDALGNRTERVPANRLADKTPVKQFGEDKDGNAITAAASEVKDGELGPFGMALPHSGELMGGNLQKVLEAPLDEEAPRTPLTKERAAMMTPVYQKLAGLVNRPPAEWGILGPGDRVRGHMLLLDLHTGEKVRAMDGHRINEGELYANLRQLPESLAQGDTIQQVLGG